MGKTMTKGGKAAAPKKVVGPKVGKAVANAVMRGPEPKKAANKPKASPAELDALHKTIDAAGARLEKAKTEAAALTDKARALVADAKEAYQAALAPYRETCRKAGVECQYEGGRKRNLSEKVSFLVEKTNEGVRVTVKGRPETEEVIPLATLRRSVNKAAYAYTDKHLGPKEQVGNKGGSLSNRLRAVG